MSVYICVLAFDYLSDVTQYRALETVLAAVMAKPAPSSLWLVLSTSAGWQ